VPRREEDFIVTSDIRIRVRRGGMTVMLHVIINDVKDEDEIR
jgi:hypothetical protein